MKILMKLKMNLEQLLYTMNEGISKFLTEYQLPIKILVVLIVTVVAAKVISKLYSRFIEKSAAELDEDYTNYKFLQHSLSTIIYLLGFSFAIWNIPFLKPIAQSMVAGAGILAIAVGFASQQALGNIISGVFIVIFKPYKINDRISFNTGLRGIIEDISLRHTVIRNFENQRIIVPNSIISNEILVNSDFSDSRICKFIEVGISYGSDIDLAKKIMAEEIEAHPENIDVRTEEDIKNKIPRVTVRVILLGESSVNLRGWAWAADSPKSFVMQCDLFESIKKRFDTEGINIPFPQRTVSYLDHKK